ncbi:hypothetical protein BC670_0176 [Flavobacterium branchiophilum]|uniref:Uncharacterized protein n=1 Tax=Flavobacterium branchiophilum TaxID=55197 RepID=A0A543FZY7_9FLAO|nr:hypothetical protein BC670_0176 [Flavobacterium branchiophilum]
MVQLIINILRKIKHLFILINKENVYFFNINYLLINILDHYFCFF